MKEFRNKLIVHGLMKINDKYLVIKRSIIKRGKPNVYPEYWDIPGGSVEDFETKVKVMHSDYMSAHANFSSVDTKKNTNSVKILTNMNKKSKPKKNYGNLFD